MRKQKLTEGWMFYSGNGSSEVSLPHDAMIMRRREENGMNTTNTGYFQGEDCSYEKELFVPEDAQQAVLEFDGVYKDAVVSVNGRCAGGCHYGYTNFLVDMTPFMRSGAVNTVTVQVHNSDGQNSRWYTGTGIYRDVFFHCGGEVCVPPDGVQITTPDIEKDLAVVEILVNLSYVGETEKTVWVKNEVFDDCRVVASDKAPITLQTDKKACNRFRQRCFVENPKCWDTDHPSLYRCQTTVYEGEDILDQTETVFGIRKIQLDPIHGFRLNGKARKLRGGCIHHDNGVVGACDYMDSEIRKIRALKKAGFNAIRISHHPASKAVLEACDQLGMLVMDETFDMWNIPMSEHDFHLHFQSDWEMVIESLVRKDFNHPSVVLYSIGNEIPEIGKTLGGITGRRLSEKIRSIDRGRFITNAINGMMCVMDDMDEVVSKVFTKEEIEEKKIKRPVTDINYALTLFLDRTEQINLLDQVTDMLAESTGFLDVTGYNYAAGRYRKEQEERPGRLTVGSETFPSEIGKNWPLIESIPQTIGDFTWTAWDYLGETGIGFTTYNTVPSFSQPYPVYMAYVGDFDITGFRRPASYYREIVWGLRKDPFIAVWDPAHAKDDAFFTPWSIGPAVASWTWDGSEGTTTKVEVYSNADEVELFLNGMSLGRRIITQEDACRLFYEVPYEPGTLKAVSYIGGKESGTWILKTAGEAAAVSVQMDKKKLPAGENALCHVRISLVDSDGNRNMHESDCVLVSVSGAGTLQGMGSADPKSNSNFFDTEWETFEGSLLAVVRAGADAGEINVQVVSQRFGKQNFVIPVV